MVVGFVRIVQIIASISSTENVTVDTHLSVRWLNFWSFSEYFLIYLLFNKKGIWGVWARFNKKEYYYYIIVTMIKLIKFSIIIFNNIVFLVEIGLWESLHANFDIF